LSSSLKTNIRKDQNGSSSENGKNRKYLGELLPNLVHPEQRKNSFGRMQMIRVTRCAACDGSGKENAPPGIHKKCNYCRGTGWVEYREIIRRSK
jgi:hypothetical protein